MNAELLVKKWKSHKANARHKTKVRPLSLEEYTQKVIDAGIDPGSIGITRGCYQLGRYTDKGDYTVESCRFILKEQNLQEQKTNGGTLAAANKKRGRTAQDHSGVARMAQKKAKPYAFMSPDGTVYQGTNLYRFCLDMGLNQGNMVEVRNGKKYACKGWIQAM